MQLTATAGDDVRRPAPKHTDSNEGGLRATFAPKRITPLMSPAYFLETIRTPNHQTDQLERLGDRGGDAPCPLVEVELLLVHQRREG